MKKYNRRQFLGLTTAGLALAGCGKSEKIEKVVEETSGYVNVDGAALNYAVEGKGIPCIVVADGPITSLALSKELREYFKFVFLSSRFDVPSNAPSNAVTLQTIVDDVELVRERLSLDRICVFGHSISGIIALEYARKYPEHTTHVIMNGTPPGWSDEISKAGQMYWESQASNERKEILQRNWEKLRADRTKSVPGSESPINGYIANGPKSFYDPSYDCTWLFERIRINTKVVGQLVADVKANYDITSGVQVTTPVFLTLGQYDFVVHYAVWDDYRNVLPNLSYNLFEKSGHWPMLEEQELFDKKLIEWIKID